MKLNLLLALVFLCSLLSAQTFIETSPEMPLEGVSQSAIAFSDIDGDGDQDVLIVGRSRTPLQVPISWLYTNDGTGVFTKVEDAPFEGLEFGTVTFADIDGDMDEDVLITGRNASANDGVKVAKLYTNDGGTFTEVMNTPFEGVFTSSVAFADVDGDDDQDVLITGYDNSSTRLAKLYTNDGSGVFTEVANTVFDGVQHSSIAFADIDGDNDQDVLITGQNSEFEIISKLYTNDGSGVFTEVMNTSLIGIEFGVVVFADIDGDLDQDLLLAGRDSEDIHVANLYINNGGNFTEATGTNFEGVDSAAAAFADVDGDNDLDVMISGRTNGISRSTKLYTNNAGIFTELADNPFIQTTSGSVAFADIDGDNDPDLLVTGLNGSNIPISTIYTNDWMVSTFGPTERLDFEFAPYPNPTGTDKLHVNFTSKKNTIITVNVFDANGRRLIQQKEQLGIGQQTFAVDVTSLNKGSYFIQLVDDKKQGIRQFVVQ